MNGESPRLWLNGELVPAALARVPALDRGLLSGFGLFETMRAYEGRVWALEDHYRRLLDGAGVIGLQAPALDLIRRAVADVLEANELGDAGVRVTVTGGAGPPDPQDEPDEPPSVIVTAWALRDYSDLYRDGVDLVTMTEGARPLYAVKTTSYATSVAGRNFARRSGAGDALFVGGHKRVLEATGSNVFVASSSALVTPPVSDGVLPGVTRRYVMEVASQEGFEVSEKTVYLDDLKAADEVLLTSSMREIYPARSVDGDPLARSGVSERLRAAYRQLVRQRLSSF